MPSYRRDAFETGGAGDVPSGHGGSSVRGLANV